MDDKLTFKFGGLKLSRPESRPTGALRLVLRLPTHLYRFKLGWLLGNRFLLLTHRGRNSGRVYRTVLEVVRHNPQSGESVVISGWGERADWYRNIKANPALEVRTGGERYVPEQRFLSQEEAYSEILGYEYRHPLAAAIAARLLGFGGKGEATRRTFAERTRVVTFRPRRDPSVRP